MRLFTALSFPPDVLDEITRVQTQVKQLVEARRWQTLNQAHITLHFFGETPGTMLEPLQRVMAARCRDIAPFELALDGYGGFPSLAHARLLWIGVGGERDRLMALEAALRPALAAIGLPTEDRAYRPHVTLAREPKRAPVLAELPARLPVAPLAWRVTEVQLFQSELRPGGPIYTLLGRYPLAGT